MAVRPANPPPPSFPVRLALGISAMTLALLEAGCASAPTSTPLHVHNAVREHMSVQDAAARAAAEAATKIAVERLLGGAAKKAVDPLPCAGRDGSISTACAKAHGLK